MTGRRLRRVPDKVWPFDEQRRARRFPRYRTEINWGCAACAAIIIAVWAVAVWGVLRWLG